MTKSVQIKKQAGRPPKKEQETCPEKDCGAKYAKGSRSRRRHYKMMRDKGLGHGYRGLGGRKRKYDGATAKERNLQAQRAHRGLPDMLPHVPIIGAPGSQLHPLEGEEDFSAPGESPLEASVTVSETSELGEVKEETYEPYYPRRRPRSSEPDETP